METLEEKLAVAEARVRELEAAQGPAPSATDPAPAPAAPAATTPAPEASTPPATPAATTPAPEASTPPATPAATTPAPSTPAATTPAPAAVSDFGERLDRMERAISLLSTTVAAAGAETVPLSTSQPTDVPEALTGSEKAAVAFAKELNISTT